MLLPRGLLILILLFSAPSARAQSDEEAPASDPPEQSRVCVNGASPKNHDLLDSFEASQDPLKMAYLADKARRKNPFLAFVHAVCDQEPLDQKNHGFLAKLAEAVSLTFAINPSDLMNPIPVQTHEPATVPEVDKKPNHQKQVKENCITAATQRRPGNTQYACTYAKNAEGPHKQNIAKVVGNAASESVQCFTQDMVDYLQFAMNQALDCMAGEKAIDSRFIWKKANAETAFNFSLASKGGRGLMQITSDARNELTGPKARGRYILEGIANSTRKSCLGFKEIALRDLQNPPALGDDSNCNWVSPGDGIARSLIYGIGYHLFMLNNEVVPALEKSAPTLKNKDDVQNMLATKTYGREGVKATLVLVKEKRLNNVRSEDDAKKIIKDSSPYIQENEGKHKEVLCIMNGVDSCDNAKFSKSEMAADECVSAP